MMSTSTEILLRSFLCRIHELLRDGEVTTLISIVLVVADDLFGLFGVEALFQSCFKSTETIRLIRDGMPRTATSTFTQLLISGGGSA